MATTLAFPTERPTTATRPVRFLLVALVVGWLALFLLLPLVSVFAEALRQGLGALPKAVLRDPPGHRLAPGEGNTAPNRQTLRHRG